MGTDTGDFLTNNEFLATGDYLVSSNGLCFAIMQLDGNLCVYKGSGPDNNTGLVWAASDGSDAGNYFAIMQGDGNLCVYIGTDPGNNGGLKWASGSQADESNYFAIIQDDGNFCIYPGTSPETPHGDAIWATNTSVPQPFSPFQGGNFLRPYNYLATNQYLVSSNKRYFAIMQSDGNLCVYKGPDPSHNGGLAWAAGSESAGEDACFTVMQGDGNLCVYRGTDPDNNKGLLWGATRPQSYGNYFAVMQDDGNLCVYDGTGPKDSHGDAIWSTGIPNDAPVSGIRVENKSGLVFRVMVGSGGNNPGYTGYFPAGQSRDIDMSSFCSDGSEYCPTIQWGTTGIDEKQKSAPRNVVFDRSSTLFGRYTVSGTVINPQLDYNGPFVP